MFEEKKDPPVNPRWNSEYEAGAHWEKGPSSQMKSFVAYLTPGCEVLDAGCGSGRDSLFLSTQGYNVSGIDISDVAIGKAVQRASEQKLPIKFVVGGLENLPYQDGEFDGAYSGYVLENTDLEKSIPEIARVLKPGAIAYLVVFLSTQYEDPSGSEFNTAVNQNHLHGLVSGQFDVLSEKVDEYTESDQHGEHKHIRDVLILRRRE